MDKDSIKNKINDLVLKYEEVSKSGRSGKYNEEETKKDFILPLFEVLGWSVADKREVSAEESQSGGRVDYGFYLNDRAKFYLEAKSFPTDLNREEFANQAIRYSWNKGVTWSVLTNFESIKVFNAQDISKYLSDKLFFEIPYSKYLERFDQLWLLSREAFLTDLIDKEAERVGKKILNVSVSATLYKDLNECRNILTQDLSKWNEKVDKDLIDEGVQKILDRLIFLRVAEDRGLEPETLRPLIREWKSRTDQSKVPLYKSMVNKFREFDEIYNSNLFSPHPFEEWDEYSGATEKVVDILYGKKGYYEYDFKIMPADVLGTVYENYLGFKLLQSKKKTTITKDDRKRKEHGIYYTPDFIVDYIVKNALKPVLDKCGSVEALKKIKVLDPACGSGSFLIKAFQLIREKYREFGYKDNNVFINYTILLDNIFGVDLDPQAVEIARLNLLISALDERTKLPVLSDNIKNGNSLISGTDEELKKYFGKDYKDKKPFNWEEEFPEVFRQGGFDVVMGNPPYVFSRGNMDEQEKKYYYDNFSQTQFKLNTYVLFIERSFTLMDSKGVLGFILPNNWLTLEFNSDLRKFILEKTFDIQIVGISDKVFQSASVDNSILFFKKVGKSNVEIQNMNEGGIRTISESEAHKYLESKNNVIRVGNEASEGNKKICDKITTNSVELGTIALVKNGIQAYTVGEGKPIQTQEMKLNRVYHSKKQESDAWIKYVDGVDIGRYFLGWSGQYIKYGENLSRPRKSDLFVGDRILVRQIPSKPPYSILASFTREQIINDNNGMIVKLNNANDINIYYLLALLNSKLMSFWFNTIFNKFQRKIFPQFKVNELAQFPIVMVSKEKQSEAVNIVKKLLQLNRDIKNIEINSEEWHSIKSEIEKTDKKIDEEVYKLYGLTSEEIAIVEGIS